MTYVKLTAKVLLLLATTNSQIICHPKNRVFLAGGDKKSATKRQAFIFLQTKAERLLRTEQPLFVFNL